MAWAIRSKDDKIEHPGNREERKTCFEDDVRAFTPLYIIRRTYVLDLPTSFVNSAFYLNKLDYLH